MAHMAGYPAFLNLWYYDRRAAFWYARWETSNAQRRQMVAHTAGRMPFDGDTGGVPEPNLQWRHFPFKEILAKSRGKDADATIAIITQEITFAEDEILRSIAELNHEIQRLAMAAGTDPTQSSSGAAADATGPIVSAFLKHIGTLLNDPQSLYSVYMRYTQSWVSKTWGNY